MTPAEFRMTVDIYQDKQKADAEKDLLLAYMTAYFHRIDKLEPFENYRSRMDQETKPKEKMTDDEMLKQVMELNKLMGGSSE